MHGIRALALVPLLEWDTGRPPEGARRLESRVGGALRARLSATIPAPDALYGALQAEIELFREIQACVCPRHSVNIGGGAAHVIHGAIEHGWASRHG